MNRLRAILIALLMTPGVAGAETWASLKGRITKAMASHDNKMVQLLVDNTLRMPVYDLNATLTSASDSDGILAYALDNDTFYFRANGAWGNKLSATGVLTLANGGTFDNATNGAFEWNETDEGWLATHSTNLITFSSDTSATFAFTPAVGFTGDATLAGGAGAATFTDSASSIVLNDNDTSALDIGSTGALSILRVSTSDSGAAGLTITGVTAQTALSVPVGETSFTEGVAAPVVATALMEIRFCGNGSATGAAHYMGPVLEADIINGTGGEQDPVDVSFGSTFCDGLDNATEGTADRVWHTSFAFKPVAMTCVGRCTGATAANDVITYQLRDDTASVTGMTCAAAAWSGDDTPAQCSVRDASPATVAANSAIAVLFTGTDDACDAGGDDFECMLFVTF